MLNSGARPSTSPNLRYSRAASGELQREQVREADAYAARAKLVLAVVFFSQLFSQVTENLGTQRRLHQTRRIQVAPVILNLALELGKGRPAAS